MKIFSVNGLKLFVSASVLLSGIVYQSCTKGFNNINNDPTHFKEQDVSPSFQVAGTLSNVIPSSSLDPGMHERMTQLTNDVFAQYSSNEGFNTQYGLTEDEWITSFYKDYHTSFVSQLAQAIYRARTAEAASGKHSNEIQIARIWKAWIFSRATDIWGDIPYFKVGNVTGEPAPYDKQELIYADLLKELKEASDSLSSSNPRQLLPDLVFNDDISKWKKFANSLRLRLAMRISQVNPTLAKQNAEAAITAGIMSSSADACLILKSPDYGWGNDYEYPYYYGWGGENMSRSMENLLTGLGGQPFPEPPGITYIKNDAGIALPANENQYDPNKNLFKRGVPSIVDPRGPMFFNVTTGPSGASAGVNINGTTVDTRNRWHGVPAGLSSSASSLTQYSYQNTARLGAVVSRNPKRSYEVLTYHEVCFLVAEAAYKGWNVGGGTAQAWYEKGIRESMKWHDAVTGVFLSNYGSTLEPEVKELIDASRISDVTIDNYINSVTENTYGTTVAWNNNSGKTFLGIQVDGPLSKIITQKYIGIFPDGGWEAWADHRRLHLPVLIPFAAPDASVITSTDGGPGNFPRRVRWPAVEAINNKALYDKAVLQQGPNMERTKIWWDPF
jgi:hypothetical protein